MCNTKKKNSGKEVKKHQYENKLGKHPFFGSAENSYSLHFLIAGEGEKEKQREILFN